MLHPFLWKLLTDPYTTFYTATSTELSLSFKHIKCFNFKSYFRISNYHCHRENLVHRVKWFIFHFVRPTPSSVTAFLSRQFDNSTLFGLVIGNYLSPFFRVLRFSSRYGGYNLEFFYFTEEFSTFILCKFFYISKLFPKDVNYIFFLV